MRVSPGLLLWNDWIGGHTHAGTIRSLAAHHLRLAGRYGGAAVSRALGPAAGRPARRGHASLVGAQRRPAVPHAHALDAAAAPAWRGPQRRLGQHGEPG